METKQMEVLAVFDEKNYDDTTKVYEKYNVRGVIFRDGKLSFERGSCGICYENNCNSSFYIRNVSFIFRVDVFHIFY